MQPSQSEIQREFETLRDIRRRSTSQGGPGTLLLDPDLPAQPTSPVSPTSAYWGAGPSDSSTAPRTLDDVPENNDGGSTNPSDDPFHLFWVPAHMHPELAPGEFRTFLKEHARVPPADGSAHLSRSGSTSSSLGRKTSMLSKQYKPRENDGVEEERVVSLKRNRSRIYDQMPQLTISDLQKLEELAEEASQSDDPSKLRSVLRRSLSLNVSPSVIDQMDDMPDLGEDADAPIIVPRPNQILRRAARTKIRKPGLAGDGGGHRFAASTRRRSGGRAATVDVQASSDISSSDHGHADLETPQQRTTFVVDIEDESEESYAQRRNTYSEESMIYDAYVRDEDEKDAEYLTASPPVVVELPISRPPAAPEVDSQQIATVIHHPQPQRHLSPPIVEPSSAPSRTPSPEPSSFPPSPEAIKRYTPAESLPFLTTPPGPNDKRKDKNKKGILSKWSGDKGTKKSGKDKEREREQKEKESSFFGSLFGGSKKKQEEHSSHILGHGGSGPATAAALLGASKSSKAYQPPTSPQLAGAYARYPIHVERAVYRLSHIKLANPRRPLYEQVLISNLMFWYLGVINKTQPTPGQNQQNQAAGQAGSTTAQGQASENSSPASNSPPDAEEQELERERDREREERARAERERLEREQERERMEQKKETRRGSLTKPVAPGSAGSGRRAEMPVKGPQYGLQHQAIEQEYGVGGPHNMGPGSVPIARTASAPPSAGSTSSNHNGGYHRLSQPQSSRAPAGNALAGSYSQPQNQNYYNPSSGGSERSGSPGRAAQSSLPPGAMPPTSFEQNWLASPLSSSNQKNQPSSGSNRSPPLQGDTAPYRPTRSSRSPPPGHRNPNKERSTSPSGAKLAGRSLSANAVAPPPQPNGNLKKKVASAAAHVPARRPKSSEDFAGGEEEDVPLAVWQQQRRK